MISRLLLCLLFAQVVVQSEADDFLNKIASLSEQQRSLVCAKCSFVLGQDTVAVKRAATAARDSCCDAAGNRRLFMFDNPRCLSCHAAEYRARIERVKEQCVGVAKACAHLDAPKPNNKPTAA